MDTRRAARQDLPQIEKLLEAEGLPPLPRALPLSNLVVALEGSSVLGVVGLDVVARYGILRVLVVDGARRRQGLGASLVRSIVARCHELGLREIYAVAANAAEFLAAQGFELVAGETLPGELRSRLAAGAGGPDASAIVRLPLETRW
jgi:N-acetylglutamate synthase-like GNAT family acetyltransferase